MFADSNLAAMREPETRGGTGTGRARWPRLSPPAQRLALLQHSGRAGQARGHEAPRWRRSRWDYVGEARTLPGAAGPKASGRKRGGPVHRARQEPGAPRVGPGLLSRRTPALTPQSWQGGAASGLAHPAPAPAVPSRRPRGSQSPAARSSRSARTTPAAGPAVPQELAPRPAPADGSRRAASGQARRPEGSAGTQGPGAREGVTERPAGSWSNRCKRGGRSPGQRCFKTGPGPGPAQRASPGAGGAPPRETRAGQQRGTAPPAPGADSLLRTPGRTDGQTAAGPWGHASAPPGLPTQQHPRKWGGPDRAGEPESGRTHRPASGAPLTPRPPRPAPAAGTTRPRLPRGRPAGRKRKWRRGPAGPGDGPMNGGGGARAAARGRGRGPGGGRAALSGARAARGRAGAGHDAPQEAEQPAARQA